MKEKIVFYFHGKDGKGESPRSQMFRNLLPADVKLVCPTIPFGATESLDVADKAVMDVMLENVNAQADVVVVGMSLGGWLATVVCETWGFKNCILINPSLSPATSLPRSGVSKEEADKYFAVSPISGSTIFCANRDELFDFATIAKDWEPFCDVRHVSGDHKFDKTVQTEMVVAEMKKKLGL